MSGTVTDGSGEPVADIRVDVVSASHEAWSLPTPQLVDADSELGESWRAFTDEQGSYRIPDVAGGVHRVVFAWNQPRWATPSRPTGEVTLEQRTTPGRQVRARTDAAGRYRVLLPPSGVATTGAAQHR